MSAHDQGGYACPALPGMGNDMQGMTLLDYFAAIALQGLLAADKGWWGDTTARNAYDLAAAMLAERARRAGEGRS